MNTRTLAATALACAAAVSLSACSTFSGSPLGGPAAQQQFVDNLSKFNEAAAKNCTGGGDFSWSPPLPPTGNMHLHCEIGQPTLPPAVVAALAAAGFVPTAATAPTIPPATAVPK